MTLGRKPMPLPIAVQNVPKLQKETKTKSVDSLDIMPNIHVSQVAGYSYN
jgi:hypothetical protein